MPLYRILCIARTNVPESSLSSSCAKALSYVLQCGGQPMGVENYGKRHLGYNLRQKAGVAQQVSGGKRPEYGRYFSLKFVSNPATQKKVMELFANNEGVLRCSSYKTDEKSFSRAQRNSDGSWAH